MKKITIMRRWNNMLEFLLSQNVNCKQVALSMTMLSIIQSQYFDNHIRSQLNDKRHSLTDGSNLLGVGLEYYEILLNFVLLNKLPTILFDIYILLQVYACLAWTSLQRLIKSI